VIKVIGFHITPLIQELDGGLVVGQGLLQEKLKILFQKDFTRFSFPEYVASLEEDFDKMEKQNDAPND